MLYEPPKRRPFKRIVPIDTGSGSLMDAIALGRKLKNVGLNIEFDCITDTKYAPYGLKSDEVIKRRLVGAIQYADYQLSSESLKIIACNTASQFKNYIRDYVDLNLGQTVSIIDPTVAELKRLGEIRADCDELLLQTGESQQALRIAIFATQNTTERGYIYERAQEAVPNAIVSGIACLHLATMIDNGGIVPILDNITHAEVVAIQRKKANDLTSLITSKHPISLLQYLKDDHTDLPLLKADVERNVINYIHPKGGEPIPEEAKVIAVLACTHFPKVAKEFYDAFKSYGRIKPHIIDQHDLVASDTLNILNERGLEMELFAEPRITIHTTGSAAHARTMLKNLLADDEKKHGDAIFNIYDVEIREIEIPEMPLADFRAKVLEEQKKRQNLIWHPRGNSC